MKQWRGHAVDLVAEHVAWRKNIHLHSECVQLVRGEQMRINSQHVKSSFSACRFVGTLPHLIAFPFLHLWADVVPFNHFILLHPFLTHACVFFSRAKFPTLHDQNTFVP